MPIPIKKKIKIALVLGTEGTWWAYGAGSETFDESMDNAVEGIESDGGQVLKKLEVEVEVDAVNEIEIEKVPGKVL